ncbi:hypothetical protein [Candidatus Burkholderia verschuerenii]|uniref:hypothetical protein n=1 Tax=Candidatus Burkholderia verschuerenii TaxID=242163 RepID=UPI00067D66BF|nr:hypothetical protein [Candidatus Burkholderia verschuerenii]
MRWRARNQLQGTYTYAIDTLGIRELAVLRDNLAELTQKPVVDLYDSPRFRADTSNAWAQVQARLRAAA